jgi:hypothetical protein
MAKIKIVGDAVVLTSSIKFADIKTMSKFKPQPLKLKDLETKEIVFVVETAEKASISKFGVAFNAVNADGFAEMTLLIPQTEDKKAFVKDTYGYVLLSLNILEDQIAAFVTVTADEFLTMDESIVTL